MYEQEHEKARSPLHDACPNYVGRWEPTPYLLDRVAAGEVPKEYIGRRNMLSYEDGVGTVLLTEGVHFVIDEEGV